LDLSHNNLSGSIPNALANLKNLQSLWATSPPNSLST
jgi:hypothetical protein